MSRARRITSTQKIVRSMVIIVIILSACIVIEAFVYGRSALAERREARTVAREEMEKIRALPYADVGIAQAIPEGKVPKHQLVQEGAHSYDVTATIRNIDDPKDGMLEGTPSDTTPADYKSVLLDVTCLNCSFFPSFQTSFQIMPQEVGTASFSGGISIAVSTASGAPVEGASVHIINPDLGIAMDDETDENGTLNIIDAPPSNAYKITVAKTGYVQTNISDASTAVTAGHMSHVNFSIDRTGSLTVSAVDTSCKNMPDTAFSLVRKENGTLLDSTRHFTTSVTGSFTLFNLNGGTYSAVPDNDAYVLAGEAPAQMFKINPAENATVQMILVPRKDNALLISVVDSENKPLDGALVTIRKADWNDTKSTNNVGTCGTPGQAYWDGLTDGTYSIAVSKDGYQPYQSQINVSSPWQGFTISLER